LKIAGSGTEQGIDAWDQARPQSSRGTSADFSNLAGASGARRFLPIRRIFGCGGIPLIFACSGRFNSLIGRKNSLIR
jgi:hypothetical protein